MQETQVWSLVREDSMPQSYWAHIPQPLSLCSRAHKPQLLSLCAATTEAHTCRACAPQQAAMRSPYTATESSPHSPQLQKTCWNQQRPTTVKVALTAKNELANNAGGLRTAGLIPESGRSPTAGNGNPLQHSCLENPLDRGAWRATVHRVSNRHNWSDLT